MAHKIATISGGRDENGIITITQPWWCDTLEECFTVGGPSPLGLAEKSRSFGVWDPDSINGGFQVGITYEGLDTEFPEKDSETFDLDDEFSEQPIEKFHDLEMLQEKYGAEMQDIDGEKKLIFPPSMPSGQSSGGGGFGKGEEASGEKNKLFGQKTFPQYESVWVHTYSRKSMPRDLLSRVGRVVTKPPGNPPTPKDRDWFIMAPVVQVFKGQRGVRIVDKYKLSPPGGWPKGIGDITII